MFCFSSCFLWEVGVSGDSGGVYIEIGVSGVWRGVLLNVDEEVDEIEAIESRIGAVGGMRMLLGLDDLLNLDEEEDGIGSKEFGVVKMSSGLCCGGCE